MTQRSGTRRIAVGVLVALGAVAVAAPAHAATAYILRPAVPDPLLWVGLTPSGMAPALTVPSPTEGSRQAWIFQRVAGDATGGVYLMRNGANRSACLGSTGLMSSSNCVDAPRGLWRVRDANNNQIRAVGLLAYGRDGSRVRFESSGENPPRCLGFYGTAPHAGWQLRMLGCSSAVGQQFTVTRTTIP
jgi:hypothetical protein